MTDPVIFYPLLVITGLIAGVINTLAGGGSNLTIPALMLLGMPADIANATNRVGVFFQCLVSSSSFRRHGRLDLSDGLPILGICLAGGLLGSLAASFTPNLYLKPLILAVMVLMALIILLRPNVVAPPPGTPAKKVSREPKAWLLLFLAGLYGGFVQAGVGFILIATIAGALKYDLVRSNALKVFCALAFTSVALLIFIARDQVEWLPGLILAAGTATGGWLGVKLALRTSQGALKWFLFLMTLVACTAAYFS